SVVTLLLAPAILAQPSDLAVKIRERLEQVRAETGYSGITAGVAFDVDRNIAAAAGFADAAQKIELTPTSRMLAGSTGKTFVAAAILQAVDEGKLDLDSRIE